MSIVRKQLKSGKVKHYARVHRGAGKYEYGPYRDTPADAKVDEARLILEQPKTESRTVAALCDWFLESYPERPRPPHNEPPRASTVSNAKYAIRAFRSRFGELRPEEIDRDSLKAWAAKNRWAVSACKTMFNDAIDSELVSAQPFQRIRGTAKGGRRDIVVPTLEEVQLLAEIAEDVHGEYGPTFRALLLWLAYTTMRPGEVFVLRHSDIEGDVIHVAANLGGTGDVTTPKNHRPRRIILPNAALEAIRSMPRPIDTDLIFTSKRGKRLSEGLLTDYFKSVRATFLAKLTDVRRRQLDSPGQRFTPYVLRHFGATYLLEAPPHGLGVDLADVAVQLGHEDINITRRYLHVAQERARERLRRAMNPAPVAELRSIDGER